jgi:hypothetical protein
MKRGKRIAFTVAATGVVMVLGVGILYRRVVLDHIQAWHFQLTTKTETIRPSPVDPFSLPTDRFERTVTQPEVYSQLNIYDRLSDKGKRFSWHAYPVSLFLHLLANYSVRPVIFSASENPDSVIIGHGSLTTESVVRLAFKDNGWRVLDQRFPRRAFVVIRANP